MEFAHAERLWLLLPWTAVILLLGRDQHRALGWLRERVHPKRLGTLTRYASTNFLWHFAWLWLAGALLVGAAAGPYAAGEGEGLEEGHTVVFLVDASFSMVADDPWPHPKTGLDYPSRLAKARAFGAELVDALPAARIGVISFSGESVIHVPPTRDHGAVRLQLGAVDAHQPERSQGTEFAAGFASVIHLQRHTPGVIQVVLLSDGDLTSDTQPFETELALFDENGIVVHTVAFGSDEGHSYSLYRRDDFARFSAGEREATPRIATTFRSRRDRGALRSIAAATGGVSVVAETDWVFMLAEAIAARPPTRVARTGEARADRTGGWVAAFLVLFLLEWAWFQRGTRSASPAPWIAAGLSASLLLTGCSSDLAEAYRRNEVGRAKLALGQADAASRDFEVAAASRTRAHIPLYNLGLSQRRGGDFGSAHRSMEEALLEAPRLGDAYLGDGTVLYDWGDAELDPAGCRFERTRDLWQRAQQRFERLVGAEDERGWDWLGRPRHEEAAANAAFVRGRLEELAELERECSEDEELADLSSTPEEAGEPDPEPEGDEGSDEDPEASDEPDEEPEGGEGSDEDSGASDEPDEEPEGGEGSDEDPEASDEPDEEPEGGEGSDGEPNESDGASEESGEESGGGSDRGLASSGSEDLDAAAGPGGLSEEEAAQVREALVRIRREAEGASGYSPTFEQTWDPQAAEAYGGQEIKW